MTKIADAVVLLDMPFEPDASLWREVAKPVDPRQSPAAPSALGSARSISGSPKSGGGSGEGR